MTANVSDGTMVVTPKMVEVNWTYCFERSDGKVVTRMLHFVTSEEQFKQYQNNIAVLASV